MISLTDIPPDNQYAEISDESSTCYNITPPKKRGTNAEYTKAKLKRDNPELFERDDIELLKWIAESKEVGVNNVSGLKGFQTSVGDNITNAKRGTTKAQSIKTLSRQAPEHYDKLVKGEYKSANEAMIAAGLRTKKVTVEDTPEGFARFLLKHWTNEQIALRLLTQQQKLN